MELAVLPIDCNVPNDNSLQPLSFVNVLQTLHDEDQLCSADTTCRNSNRKTREEFQESYIMSIEASQSLREQSSPNLLSKEIPEYFSTLPLPVALVVSRKRPRQGPNTLTLYQTSQTQPRKRKATRRFNLSNLRQKTLSDYVVRPRPTGVCPVQSDRIDSLSPDSNSLTVVMPDYISAASVVNDDPMCFVDVPSTKRARPDPQRGCVVNASSLSLDYDKRVADS